MNNMSVWVFEEAPKKYQKLSTSSGDEDWVLLVPAGVAWKWMMDDLPPSWVSRMDSDLDPQKIIMENGDVVYIGSHA